MGGIQQKGARVLTRYRDYKGNYLRGYKCPTCLIHAWYAGTLGGLKPFRGFRQCRTMQRLVGQVRGCLVMLDVLLCCKFALHKSRSPSCPGLGFRGRC